MLVYLREALEQRGGLAKIDIARRTEAKRSWTGPSIACGPSCSPKAPSIIGLAPMLWATGTGAEIMRPMAAPVLGGVLVADEVIDLLLPVLFYHVRARRWRKLHAEKSAKPPLAT